MIRNLALLLAGAFALAGCNADREPVEQPTPEPSPILYEIADSSGAARGWLFGTMHALPDGVELRTNKLEQVIDEADILVVEVGDLADTRGISEIFSQLAVSPGQPNIRTRVSPRDLPELDELLSKGRYSSRDFANVETWAAALMLAQVSSTGSPRNGVDRALLLEFPSHRVVELEGTLAQLSIFDRLAQEDQDELLAGIIDEYRTVSADPGRLRRAWLSGDEDALIEATQNGIMSDPELYEALLADRNRDWIGELAPLLKEGRAPLIAVGTAHLVGPDGLATLLEQQGYSVTRLQ